MRTSESIVELSQALAAAQGELENTSKDATNPQYNNSRYSSLAEATNTVRPVFARHGLSVVQMPEIQGDGVVLTTRLLHVSGQFLEGEYPVRPVKADPQGYGSAITYARRYTLLAIAGIAPEDDDGNAASLPITRQPVRTAVVDDWRKRVADKFRELSDAYTAQGLYDVFQGLLESSGVSSSEEFASYDKALACYRAIKADMAERERKSA